MPRVPDRLEITCDTCGKLLALCDPYSDLDGLHDVTCPGCPIKPPAPPVKRDPELGVIVAYVGGGHWKRWGPPYTDATRREVNALFPGTFPKADYPHLYDNPT